MAGFKNMYYDNWMVGIRPLQVFPGLGAFPLSPSIDSSSEIERFLSDVATHLCDRMTRWEEYKFQRHAVYSSLSPVTLLQADAIRGLYKAVKASGVFPLPATRHLASPASVRWIAIPDDDPNIPPHVLRVAANGYRGTLNLAALTHDHPQFIGVDLGDQLDKPFQIWRLA